MLLAIIGATAVAGVASADLILPPPPRSPGPNTIIAVDAVNSARAAVAKRDHACRAGVSPGRGW